MHWWRIVLVVAGLAVGVFAPGITLFGMVPIVLWCGMARTRWTGLVVGLVLVGLLAWFVIPRDVGWSGPWVPSDVEKYWLYGVITAFVCQTGVLVERREPAGVLRLLAMVGAGFLITGVVLLDRLEARPLDEGVLPAPPGLRVVEGEGHCGSGGCSRDVTATGDGALQVMRAHLTARGFTAARPLNADERMCRRTGIVVPHEVCAELRNISPSEVQVLWYVNHQTLD